MGVTRIVRINNDSDNDQIYVRNIEKDGDIGSTVTLTGNTASIADMAIPWCVNESDYANGHFIYIVVTSRRGKVAFQMWQAWWDDGDWVRIRRIPVAEKGWPPFAFAKPMQGASHVDGRRVLVFGPEAPYLAEV